MARGLTFDVVGECKDEFADLAASSPFEQGREIQLFRADTGNGRQFSVENMIDPAMRSAPLQRGKIRHLFDDTHDTTIACFIGTDRTPFALGKIAAGHTPSD